MSQTPEKVYGPKPEVSVLCRLCGSDKDKTMLKIFSDKGIKKKLSEKIYTVAGITVKTTDAISLLICRKCENFLNKVMQFRHTVYENNNFQRRQQSVKRLLPLEEEPARRVEEIDNVKIVTQELQSSCEKLCHKTNGSYLYGHKYSDLEGFSFENVWEELLTKHPSLVRIMQAVAKVDDIKESTKIQFSVCYAILMKIRWQHLSLFQRVMTVMMIEGGAAKEVIISYVLLINSIP